ncbi:MAG: ABC transporter ATP-binding protein [Micromonosporaceae bacterium]|nr:ABC transporter ATP-binding protein [Micromonosporaceae bacterium]
MACGRAGCGGHGVDGGLGPGLRVLGRAVRDEPVTFAIATAGSAVFAITSVGYAYVVGGVVGRVAVPALAAGWVGVGTLALAAGAILAVAGVKVAGIFGRRLGAASMQFALQARYRRAVTRRYLELPLHWHRRHATGTLLSNANADVEATWYPIGPFPLAVGTLVMLVAAVVSLLLVDWVLALVGLALIPALFGINVGYSRFVVGRVTRAQQLRAELSAIAHESFDGALTVKTLGREAQETARFADRSGELRDAMISVGRVRGLFDPVLDMLPGLGTLVVLVVGAVRMRQGAVSLADVVSVAFLFTVLALPLRAIGWVLAELPRSAAGWRRVQAVLSATDDMAYGARRSTAAGPAVLHFDKVSFGYADGKVLDEVSLEVPAGQVVALVGPTGAGKSTVAALAARLLDPTAGRILLDGVDLRELTAGTLAASVALVPQLPFVFDDAVRDNIGLDRDGIDDEAAWAALRVAQADGFVAALPSGLSTVVGERGSTLSGGERQRLTLARALAGRPRLLILDDATSAVDPLVEAAILAGLRGGTGRSGSTGGCSVLVVAHRRATIALADRVVYLTGGRVIASGTHDQLLASIRGYAELVTAYERAETGAAGADRDQLGADPVELA